MTSADLEAVLVELKRGCRVPENIHLDHVMKVRTNGFAKSAGRYRCLVRMRITGGKLHAGGWRNCSRHDRGSEVSICACGVVSSHTLDGAKVPAAPHAIWLWLSLTHPLPDSIRGVTRPECPDMHRVEGFLPRRVSGTQNLAHRR